MASLGDRIREIAADRELSIEEVSRRARMARSQLNKILAGSTRSPGIVNVAKIARALGVTIDYLLVGVDEIEGPEELSVADMAALLRMLGRTHGLDVAQIAQLLEAEERKHSPGHRARAQEIPDGEPDDAADNGTKDEQQQHDPASLAS